MPSPFTSCGNPTTAASDTSGQARKVYEDIDNTKICHENHNSRVRVRVRVRVRAYIEQGCLSRCAISG